MIYCAFSISLCVHFYLFLYLREQVYSQKDAVNSYKEM